MFSDQILIEPMNYILQLVELLKNNCIVIPNSLQLKIFVALASNHKNAIEGAPNNSHRFCYQSLGLRALRNHTLLRMALQQYPANKSILLFASSCKSTSAFLNHSIQQIKLQITPLWLGTSNIGYYSNQTHQSSQLKGSKQ